MRMHAMAAMVTGLALAVASIIAPADAQVRPAVQDVVEKPIGKIVVATGKVTIERANAVVIQASTSGATDQVTAGDPVYRGDVVATGADGKVGISFTDGTSFNLSANARMALNEFVYDPKSSSNSSLISLTKGTFTFVAGRVAKTGDMKVDTPVATMGIRGTTPRVEMLDDGSVRFSTLIEEGKGRTARKPAAPAVQRSDPKPEPKMNLNICRGC